MASLPKWYDCIEEPFKELTYLLRNNGFNTICSCGHYPNPYIQMEWYDGRDDSKLWCLLSQNGYKNWAIKIHWDCKGTRMAEIVFYNHAWNEKKELASLSAIKEVPETDE